MVFESGREDVAVVCTKVDCGYGYAVPLGRAQDVVPGRDADEWVYEHGPAGCRGELHVIVGFANAVARSDQFELHRETHSFRFLRSES